jgi:hypothetical protein
MQRHKTSTLVNIAGQSVLVKHVKFPKREDHITSKVPILYINCHKTYLVQNVNVPFRKTFQNLIDTNIKTQKVKF